MTFNTALSGLRAANSDLRITGNNIANASTTGFKLSRAEFGDVYASSALGAGSNPIGSGVLLSDVAQQFSQGTVSFTDRSLDLAINGNGFFITKDGGSGSGSGATSYTRSGIFGVDAKGMIVTNSGAELQGFGADASGAIVSGRQQSLQLQTTNQKPHETTAIDESFNLDASEDVLLKQFNNSNTNGTGAGAIMGAPAASPLPGNGYNATSIDIVDNTGATPTDTIDFSTATPPLTTNATAAQLAAYINSQNNNVSATAVTRANLTLGGTGGGLPLDYQDGLLINGSQITGTTINDVVANIDRLPNITASVNTSGVITVVSTLGEDLRIDMTAADTNSTGKTLTIQPFRLDETTPVPSQAPIGSSMTIGDGQTNTKATIGGDVEFSLKYPYQLANPGAGDNLFISGNIPNRYVKSNDFDPANPKTYNHATFTNVYDSKGIAHVMTEYFVKQDDRGGTTTNTWGMYVTIDGKNVGKNDSNGNPMQARYDLKFNADGSLDTSATDPVEISNWTPLDSTGKWNGATVSPASDFTIDIAGSTQFGGAFAVSNLKQDGYSEGQLTKIEISDSGIVQARFTNGQTQVLGQVILANFTNTQGLSPLGDTSWAESFESGTAVIGVPQSGNLGSIQAGALEDSNVDLSEQLVNLIIAQRNYQANAKTIETANQVTQTIINLR